MLVTFQSKSAADILMLGDHAGPVLQAAGKPGDAASLKRGIFTVEQLPAAIAALEKAIAEEDLPLEKEDPDHEPVHPMARSVSLRQRAFPLLDMMRKALAIKEPVLWEAGSAW